MSDLAETDRQVAVGEWVKVSAIEGYVPAEGVVLAVADDGIDVLDPTAFGGRGQVLAVKWAYVAAIRRDTPAPTIIRTYVGKQQSDANGRFSEDAKRLSRAGYEPTTQSWAAGQWGCGAWLFALAACILLIGILVFLYMLIVKPEGTLTVTYAFRGFGTKTAATAVADVQAPEPAPVGESVVMPAAPVAKTLSERLFELSAAHGAGLLTDEEYERKREAIISDH